MKIRCKPRLLQPSGPGFLPTDDSSNKRSLGLSGSLSYWIDSLLHTSITLDSILTVCRICSLDQCEVKKKHYSHPKELQSKQ